MPQLAAVHSLLTLLSEVDFGGDAAACSAAARPPADELAEFSVGLRLKQQLLARRAERLARFLRLQLPVGGSPGGTPRGSSGGRSPARGSAACSPGGLAVQQNVRERESSADRLGSRSGGHAKTHWSPGMVILAPPQGGFHSGQLACPPVFRSSPCPPGQHPSSPDQLFHSTPCSLDCGWCGTGVRHLQHSRQRMFPRLGQQHGQQLRQLPCRLRSPLASALRPGHGCGKQRQRCWRGNQQGGICAGPQVGAACAAAAASARRAAAGRAGHAAHPAQCAVASNYATGSPSLTQQATSSRAARDRAASSCSSRGRGSSGGGGRCSRCSSPPPPPPTPTASASV